MTNILINTTVLARGVDIPDVENVINFDLPGDIEEYVHRIGRTGRVGTEGRAFSYFDWVDDGRIQRDLIEILKQYGQKVSELFQPLGDGWFRGNPKEKINIELQKKRNRRDGDSYYTDWDGSVTGPCRHDQKMKRRWS